MKKSDIEMFTDQEATIVNNSFDRESLPTRFRNIMLGAFFATAVILGLLTLQIGPTGIAATAILFVVIASLEKVSYVRTQMGSRGAIRKLVHRVERLEGVPFTPDNAKPTELAVDERDAA